METLCEISRAALQHNLGFLQEKASGAGTIPVVKANAYGHGVQGVVEILHDFGGCPCFAVATLEEAEELSELYPDLSILIFSRIFPEELNRIRPNMILTITSLEDLQALAARVHEPCPVHLNVNTGMNRLGISAEEALGIVQTPPEGMNITGLYSHFSSSDSDERTVFEHQLLEIKQLISELRRIGFDGLIHCANSAATLMDTDIQFDGVRLGISLYGYDPSQTRQHRKDLRPVMTLKAPLVRSQAIVAGSPVSYGERWRAAVDTRIGTLRIGYADGYNRLLTNRGHAVHNDQVFPVVGTVTMDHIMIDLGNTDVKVGEYLTVLGEEHPRTSCYTVADQLETITYEITCAVSPRVRRVYL